MSKTKWYQKPIYLLVALALVLSLAVVALPMAGTVEAASPIYVNASTGNNTWDGESAEWDGTHGPKKTIKAGIAAVDSPGTVHVAAGNYSENDITLTNNVHVLGAGADVTTIDGGGSDVVVRASAVGPGTKLDGFTITNGSRYFGGGMSNYDSSPTVTNCIFEGNSATPGYGGGIYNSGSSPTVANCTFTGNSAGEGGGMYNLNSSPTVSNCTFTGNSAEFGAGMRNYNSSPAVTKCIFKGNSALYAGGGMSNWNNSSPTVTNCIFEGNSVPLGGGGGMYNQSSSPTVTNCIFEGNSAKNYGGGMSNSNNSSPTVTNCILVNNSAGDNGGGIYTFVGSSPAIDYNDVWNNSPNNYGGSCSPGPHDISQDPMFVDPSAHDYHSKPGSPCIDAGTNKGAPTEDIEGNPRPVDGDGDGWAITDMGAYEYVPPTPPPHFRYLHSTSGWFNLTDPVGTQWHELWPFFCNEYHLSSWNDTSGDGGLSYCDRIDMYQKPDGEVRWYHVEEVTITLNVTPGRNGGGVGFNGLPPPMYIELEGGYNASVLTHPVGTQWHEIYPILCRQYEFIGWNDTGPNGKLDFCDYIELTDKWTGEKTSWHVEEVAIDIIVTIEPPPVGGEAYPVNKFAVLAPWIALAVLLAGGISWLTLRRRRAQS